MDGFSIKSFIITFLLFAVRLLCVEKWAFYFYEEINSLLSWNFNKMLLDRTLYVKPDGEFPFILPLSFISVQIWSVLPHINEIYQWLINKLLAALLAIFSYD